MTYTQEELARTQLLHDASDNLRKALRQVLNASEYNLLSNYCKAEILLELENGGEYNPLG